MSLNDENHSSRRPVRTAAAGLIAGALALGVSGALAPPGAAMFEIGNVGAATTNPAEAHCCSKGL